LLIFSAGTADFVAHRIQVVFYFLVEMQEDTEPSVRIRELKPDRVDFVLENVDLACVAFSMTHNLLSHLKASPSLANSIRRVVIADLPTVGALTSSLNLSYKFDCLQLSTWLKSRRIRLCYQMNILLTDSV